MNKLSFENIKQAYLKVIDNAYPSSQRRQQANLIANQVIEIVFNSQAIKNDMKAINLERQRKIDQGLIKKVNYQDKVYANSVFSKLDFLCDFEHIPLNFKSSFKLLLSRGYNEINSEDLDQKSEISFLSLHRILNAILDWFLKKEKQSFNYKEKIEFDTDLGQKYIEIKNNQITTFWNVRKNEKKWYKKYETVLTYVLIASPLFFILYALIQDQILYEYDLDLLSNLPKNTLNFFLIIWFFLIIIISSIELFKTLKYVVNKRIKMARLFIYSICFFTFFSFIYISLYEFYIDEDSFFIDNDPNDNGTGFMFLKHKDCIDAFSECNKKYFILDSIKKSSIYLDSLNQFAEDSIRFISLELVFKNIGEKVLDSSFVNLDYQFTPSTEKNKMNLIFQASNFNFYNMLNDRVIIVGIDDTKSVSLVYKYYNYQIETIKNYQDSIIQKSWHVRDSFVHKHHFVDFKHNRYGIKIPKLIPAKDSKIKKVSVIFDIEMH